jgi:Holliday junction resolvase RusA-like endonuclease
VKIVINDIPPSNNQYMGKTYNYAVYQREKQRWHLLIKCAIKGKTKKPIEKAIVHITYFFKNRTRRDPDNYSGKMLLDPLVREGILIDDSFDVVTLMLDGDYDKNNPRTEIEIRSIDDEKETEVG